MNNNTNTKVIEQVIEKNYALYHGDSTEVLKGMPDESIHLSVSSVPFPQMYIYQQSERDVGNCRDGIESAEHLEYIMKEVQRVTMSGRHCCIHVNNITLFKYQDGYVGRMDYRGDIIRMMQSLGWIYSGEVSIDKNPQMRAIRQNDHTLSQGGVWKDMTIASPCLLDYVIIFTKRGENSVPVPALISEKYKQLDGWITMEEWRKQLANGIWKFDNYGDLMIMPDAAWYDINEGDVLRMSNKKGDMIQAHRSGKDEKDEKHMCPLQNGVVKRLIDLYSNPQENILDMFAGQGTVPYWSVIKDRYGIGIELKDSYFRLMKRVMENAKVKSMKLDLKF